jgi:sugar O-acyltransferase (sialic acid O-acetyltransferase NeuD family)
MSGKQRLVIVGAGGHGAEVQSYVNDLQKNGWDGELLGFLDDSVPKGVRENLRVIGTLMEFVDRPPEFFQDLIYITALGDNPTRRTIVEKLEATYSDRLIPWTLIHPTAYVGRDVVIGGGTLLAPGSIVTSRVSIGKHCILNVKASVSHDCILGDYCNINPDATLCGRCRIEDGAYIGTGATLIGRNTVGRGAIIGGGAVITHNIEPDVTAVGVPARVIKRHASANNCDQTGDSKLK